MFGATVKDLWDFKKKGLFDTPDFHQDVKFLIIGSVIAFIVAVLAIKTFITFLEKHGFKLFGYYRIVAGIIIIILYFTGNALHTAWLH